MSYPEGWGANEIRYHENAEVLCTHCFKYVHEDLIKKDTDGCDVCVSCAEEIECYYCGEAARSVENKNGVSVCEDCVKVWVEDIDLTSGIDQRGDEAYFIHLKHFTGGWEVSEGARMPHPGPHFFRCLNDEGFDHRHGWIEGRKVVQWG